MNLQKMYEKRKHYDRKENAAGIAMGIVPVLGFLIFGLIPIVLGLIMSFFDFGDQIFFSSDTKLAGKAGFEYFYNIFHPTAEGVNFLNGGVFFDALATTAFMFFNVPTGIVLSLLVAFFLSKKIKCKTLFRTIFLLPFVCSAVAVTIIWGRFFGASQGDTLNAIIIKVTGKAANRHVWIQEHFYTVVYVINIWGGTGFSIILYTAALTNVNNSYYEAAKVDGANAFQIFFKITLPAISPTTFYLFITGCIGSLQTYAVPDMVAQIGGHPAAKIPIFGKRIINDISLSVIGYLQSLLKAGKAGVASACACVLALVIGVITIFNFIGSKYWVSYD